MVNNNKLHEALNKLISNYENESVFDLDAFYNLVEFFDCIKGLDVINVIRCPNCVYKNKFGKCCLWNEKVDDYDYCSYAERKK